jgi:8-oxo-dGTP diphosphatase
MEKKDIVDFVLKVEEISKVGLMFSKDPYAVDNYTCLQNAAKDFLAEKLETPIKNGEANFFQRDIYPTPNVSVRTIIFDSKREQVLLVQEKLDAGWSLPGGWTELTLSPSESALKEVREEAGAEVKLTRLVGVFDRYHYGPTRGIPEYIIVFEAELTKFVSDPCYEILARNFFPLDKLPQWSRKNNPGQMELILKAALEKKTLFD